MVMVVKKLFMIIVFCGLCVWGMAFSTLWMADDFFGDWMQWQFTYSPQPLTGMNDHVKLPAASCGASYSSNKVI